MYNIEHALTGVLTHLPQLVKMLLLRLIIDMIDDLPKYGKLKIRIFFII